MDREMFITDYGYTVMQSEFCDTVRKYQSEDDIMYYISISELPFFEPSTNIEVLTLQNIAWYKSKSMETNEIAFQFYIRWKQVVCDSNELFQIEPDTSNISEHYNDFLILRSEASITKNNIKRFLRTLNINPEFGICRYNTGINMNRLYYSLRDLELAIRFKIKKLKKIYEQHKSDTIKEVSLIFNRNFGLNFILQIDKKSFINDIESFLF